MIDWAEGYEIPEGARLRADVWYCGDDWCNCSEAQIVLQVRSPFHGGWLSQSDVWAGEFHTDAEEGATTELNREAARLRKRHNALFHRIEWPWDRSVTI